MTPFAEEGLDARFQVFYDGACRLCRRSVRWLSRLASSGSLELIDASDREGFRARAPSGVAWEDAMQAIHVRAPEGEVTSGYEAFLALLGTMPLLRPLRPLLRQGPVAGIGRGLYRLVARNRYRWVRCEDGCPIHDGAEHDSAARTREPAGQDERRGGGP